MEYSTADYLTGIGQKSFIAELMPKHPVYVNLLPADARDAIGVPGAQHEVGILDCLQEIRDLIGVMRKVRIHLRKRFVIACKPPSKPRPIGSTKSFLTFARQQKHPPTKVRVPLHLYVPPASVDAAKRRKLARAARRCPPPRANSTRKPLTGWRFAGTRESASPK